MSDSLSPPCPKCNSRKTRPNGERLFWCVKCEMLFDLSGEDGDIGYGDPARVAERREKREKKFTSGGDERRAAWLREQLRQASKNTETNP